MNRINAPDGTALVYDAYEPAHPSLAVLLLHDWSPGPGPAGAADAFGPLAAELRDAGFAAYLLDQRGHGRSGGHRGHLSRFSQLLGDLQALRRAVRRHRDVPQVLVGHGFGGLVVLRYLETQPGEPPAGAIAAAPWLASCRPMAAWKRVAARFADLWPTLPTGMGTGFMTAGARAELQWAQRAVLADCQRIERPLLLLLGGTDDVVDARPVRALADQLGSHASVLDYPQLGHDLFADRTVRREATEFLGEFRSFDLHPKNA